MFAVKTIFGQGVYLLKVFLCQRCNYVCDLCCDRKTVPLYEKGRDIMMHECLEDQSSCIVKGKLKEEK